MASRGWRIFRQTKVPKRVSLVRAAEQLTQKDGERQGIAVSGCTQSCGKFRIELSAGIGIVPTTRYYPAQRRSVWRRPAKASGLSTGEIVTNSLRA